MITQFLVMITSISISGVLFAMETQPTNKQELITLMASDATTIQVPKQSIKPLLEHLKGKPSTSDDDTTTIPAEFVNAKGLKYLKEYLETPDDEKHDIIQKLISSEPVETIYGLYRFLDCWELLQENSLSKIEQQIVPMGQIEKIIFCGSVAYAITYDGHFIKIDFKKETVKSLFKTKYNHHLYGLATNDQQNIFYFGGSDCKRRIFNSVKNKFYDLPAVRFIHIKDIQVSPNGSFLLLTYRDAYDGWIHIYDISDNHLHLCRKKELGYFRCTPAVLITADSKFIISNDRSYRPTLYIADLNGNKIKEISRDLSFEQYIAFANKDCAHIVASCNNNTIIYNLELNQLSKLEPTEHRITYMQAHNNIIVIGDEKGFIQLWKFDPAAQVVTKVNSIQHHSTEIKNIVFSPNGKLIACAAADQKVILIDCKNNLVNHWQLKRKERDTSKITIIFCDNGEQLILSAWQETIISPVAPIASLNEFKQLPSLLQKKIIYELNNLGPVSNNLTRPARLKSLCNDLEILGFEIPKIRKYLQEHYSSEKHEKQEDLQ